MNKEVKDKWLAALRSGEYTQGREYLKNEDNHCCLGVLCELYIKEHPEAAWKQEHGVNRIDGESGTPPVSVTSWSGIDSFNGILMYEHPFCKLAEMNDEDNKTFEEIADYIEKSL